EGYGRTRAALFRAGDSAARAAWRSRADLGARQFAACADHGAGAIDAGGDPQARTRHRRADRIPAERGFDRRLTARSGGVNLSPREAGRGERKRPTPPPPARL